MKKIMIVVVMIFIFNSCSNQYKAEKAVSNFIKEWATYPESYESIGFDNVDTFTNEYGLNFYKIKHAYRIKDKSGILKVTAHEFKLSESFNVYIDFMEEFE